MDSSKGGTDQKWMVKQLREAGAHVFLAMGEYGEGRLSKYCGACHIKCCLVDNRIAYSGSANFTDAALKNLELVFRLPGSPVADICDILKTLVASESCYRLME